MEHERRRGSRRTVPLWVVERDGAVVRLHRTTNLSLGGLRVSAPLAHPAGVSVELELRIAGSRAALRVEAEIVEASAAGTRVRFRRVALETRARMLEALVDAG